MFAPATRLTAACLALLVVTLGACERVDPVERVRRLHATGLYAESLEPLRELIDGGTRDPEVLYLYGVALTATGEPTLALWAFEQAMQDPEWLVPAGMARAWGALSTRSHDSAVQVVSRVLEVEPDNLPARALRARARVESRRDSEGGLADAKLVLEEDPDNLEALISKAVALLAHERADEAEVVLEQLEERFRAAELGPEVTARYCFTRVEFAKERGQLETAEERLERCLDELPGALIGVSESVDFYDELGRPERSVEVLRAALEETPSAIYYRSGLAARLRLLGREDEAEALLREAIEVEDRGQAMLGWVARGEYYLAGERADEAADALARALEIGGDAELAFLHANALLAAGRHDEALAVADSMTVPAFTFLIRGRVEQLQGRPNEALAQLEQGLELWPNNAVARYYAGRAAEDAGDLARAIGEYRYALRADPAAADTRTRLAQLYIAAGRPEAAFNTVTHGWSRRPGTQEQELGARELAAELGNRSQYVKARLQR
ncbi:MAG: tetratricopeptide repeat protein, partial [Myxococcota bacterium]